MKTDTKSIMLAAAAMAGLLTGCATAPAKQCKTCPATKAEKASCHTKADCSAKHSCNAKGNCGASGCAAKKKQ